MKIAWPGLGLAQLCLGIVVCGSLRAAGDTAGSAQRQEAPSQDEALVAVSISAANYRQGTRLEVEEKIMSGKHKNPEPTNLRSLPSPVHFVFLPGEIYESDVPYETMCKSLTAVLAKKGYINEADEKGNLTDSNRIKLILRVSYGNRSWRTPVVRTDRLAYKDGLEASSRGARTLTTLGGQVAWDWRVGGDDHFIAESNSSAANVGLFGTGRGGTGASSSGAVMGEARVTAGGRVGLTEYNRTREFHLVVVDAYDVEELRRDKEKATRLWTTFIAAPVEPGQKFSDVVATMLRKAVPYFGETAVGLQIYPDAKADVKIGEATVVPDSAP